MHDAYWTIGDSPDGLVSQNIFAYCSLVGSFNQLPLRLFKRKRPILALQKCKTTSSHRQSLLLCLIFKKLQNFKQFKVRTLKVIKTLTQAISMMRKF